MNVLIASILAILVVTIPNPAEAVLDTISQGVLAIIWSLVVGFFGKVVVLAGWLLNYSITEYVVGFGKIYKESGLGFSINTLWATVRDIFNLTFIFGLVFIGLKMIFNSSDSNSRSTLVYLILAALLVNFSLFITKFVIDFSNIAATQLASGFLSGGTYEFSANFVNLMGVSALMGSGPTIGSMPPGAGFAFVFGTLILYLVTAFVFAAGGILLIIRFVVLNLYMILSPLMFLGWVFPGFSNVSKEYWSGFLSRAFFAPAYILMIYFAHQILVNIKIAPGPGAMREALISADGALGKSSFESTIPFFIITSVFLIAAIVVAQKMGAVGATSAIAIGNRMKDKARQYATNTATYVPRFVGRKAANASGDYVTRKLNTGQSGDGKWANFLKSNAVDRTVRGTATAAINAKFGTSGSNKEQEAYRQKTETRAKNTEAINAAVELARLNKLMDSGPLNVEDSKKFSLLQPREAELQSYVAGMSTSAIEEMGDQDREVIAGLFTSTQLENINKSEKISDKAKGGVSNARKAAIEELIGKSNALVMEEVNKLSISQIETLGETWIADNSHVLSDAQMDEVKNSKKYIEAQKNTFGAKRKKKFEDMAALRMPAPAEYEQVMKGKKPKDIAKLPADLLMNPSALKYLSADVLREIATNGTLNPTQQEEIETRINLSPLAAHPSAVGYFNSKHARNNWG